MKNLPWTRRWGLEIRLSLELMKFRLGFKLALGLVWFKLRNSKKFKVKTKMNIHNCDFNSFFTYNSLYLHETNFIFSKPLSLPTWNYLVKKNFSQTHTCHGILMAISIWLFLVHQFNFKHFAKVSNCHCQQSQCTNKTD